MVSTYITWMCANLQNKWRLCGQSLYWNLCLWIRTTTLNVSIYEIIYHKFMHRIYILFFFVRLHSQNLHNLLFVCIALLFSVFFFHRFELGMWKRCVLFFGTRSNFNRLKVCHLSCKKWMPAQTDTRANVANAQ